MIVLDTETTGLLKPELADLDAQPHIVEVAMVKLDSKYRVQDKLSMLLDPGVPFDEAELKRITGIAATDLTGQPTFLEAYGKLVDFCLGERTLVAHNLEFDKGMLTTELRRIGKEHAFPYPPEQVCTVQRTTHLQGRRLKLTELYELKVGKKLKQTHRAMDDVLALVAIIKELKL